MYTTLVMASKYVIVGLENGHIRKRRIKDPTGISAGNVFTYIERRTR